MNSIRFDPKTGKYVPTAEQMKAIGLMISHAVANNSHQMVAQVLTPAVRQVAAYASWTDLLFNQMSLGFTERPSIPIEHYTAQAWYSTPSGTALYTEPGDTYATVQPRMITTGVRYNWYDIMATPWDKLSAHIARSGEEMARKRDNLAKAVLDAFFAANPARSVNSTGGVLTRSSVDLVIENAEGAHWPVSIAVLSKRRALDMAKWTNVANALWQPLPTSYADSIIREGYVTFYGGVQWVIREWCPSDEVYLVGDPAASGMHHCIFGDSRSDTADDIDNATTRIVWREHHGYTIVGGMSLWRIKIVP